MTVNAITDTKKGRTGIAPTYLHTTQDVDIEAEACVHNLQYKFSTSTPIVGGVTGRTA